MNIQYRDSDYFNTTDYFLFALPYLNGEYEFISCKVEFQNSNWYMLHGVQYKCTTVRAINCSEFNIVK